MAERLFENYMYGELLKTPGYEVEFALGLTYSLDLNALISIPMSLGMFGEIDESSEYDPIYMMAAIRKCQDKMAVFCNNGCIGVPKTDKLIYSLLADSIFPVKQIGGNFHPKLWAIQEVNPKGERQIRLIVLSKNLTFSNNLEIAVSMTGEVSDKWQEKKEYQPVLNLINWIKKLASTDKQQKIEELCRNIKKVKRFDVEAPFDKCEFLSFNKDKGLMNQKDVQDQLQGEKMIVFSPFVDVKTLKWLFETARLKTLVTCKESITNEIQEYMGERNVYVTSDNLTTDDGEKIDLHAKMYFVSNESGDYLYIGSANATNSAFNRNTEVLLKLRFIANKKNYSSFKKNTLDLVESMFIQDDGVFVEKREGGYTEEEKIFRDFVDNIKSAEIIGKKEPYRVEIKIKKSKWTMPITIKPLQSQQEAEVKANSLSVFFKKLTLKELSELYVVTVGTKSKSQKKSIVKIKTKNLPKNVEEEIIQSIVDSENAFMDYMSLYISEFPQDYSLKRKKTGGKGKGKDSPKKETVKYSAFYEELLQKVCENPQCLDSIKRDVSLFGDKVPESFNQMFKKFCEAKNKLG